MMKLSDTHFIENWNQMLTLNEFSCAFYKCSMPIFAAFFFHLNFIHFYAFAWSRAAQHKININENKYLYTQEAK